MGSESWNSLWQPGANRPTAFLFTAFRMQCGTRFTTQHHHGGILWEIWWSTKSNFANLFWYDCGLDEVPEPPNRRVDVLRVDDDLLFVKGDSEIQAQLSPKVTPVQTNLVKFFGCHTLASNIFVQENNEWWEYDRRHSTSQYQGGC